MKCYKKLLHVDSKCDVNLNLNIMEKNELIDFLDWFVNNTDDLQFNTTIEWVDCYLKSIKPNELESNSKHEDKIENLNKCTCEKCTGIELDSLYDFEMDGEG